MDRRLACISVPDFPLQVFLLGRSEWRDDAVVLLDRDEANGRILEANKAARGLGLGRGMMYGPCLGIHRNLKAGVLVPGVLEEWTERMEEVLADFSPSVEPVGFHAGAYWLDAEGLSAVFSSVRPWLEGMVEAVRGLGLDAAAAAGFSRFATYAASLGRPSGTASIFSDRSSEAAWLEAAAISCLPMTAEAKGMLQRLKVLTVGDVMKIPLPDLHRRLDPTLAEMLRFIREESRLPVQGLPVPEPSEWVFPLEDATISALDLFYAAGRLAEKGLAAARRKGLYLAALELDLVGREETVELTLRPAHPTRDEAKLKRILQSRLESLSLEEAVESVRCRAEFVRPRSSYADLFQPDIRRHRHQAAEALGILQVQRGPGTVQYAEILSHPLPPRQYALREWQGFGREAEADAADGDALAEGAIPLMRRITVEPRRLGRLGPVISRVAYSGGWWERPYSYEMAYARFRGRRCWLSRSGGEDEWTLIGWLD